MKNRYFNIFTGLLCLVTSLTGLAQPADLILNSPESGTVVHQASNSITFNPGYSYTPNGGTLTADVVDQPIYGDIVYSPAINPATYTINTSLTVGKTPGSLVVGGSAVYTIPLEIPKGINSLQPVLSVNYVSNFVDGILGMGWSVGGISAISRVNQTIYFDGKSDVIRANLNDKYALDGKRLLVTSGTYGAAGSEYRTEIEEFAKVVAWGSTGSGPEWFKVYAKSGLIYEFGNTTDSKITNISGAVLSWRVNKITDRYNNSVIITYYNSTSDDEQPIKRITYNPDSSTGLPLTRILFYYKYRADISRYCYGGTEFTRDVLLDRIEIENNGQSFKKYMMTYTRDVYSQLQKVTEYSSQGVAFNPTAVAWTAQTNQFTQTTNYSSTTDEYYFVGDFNGDGRDDLVTTPVKTSYTSSDKWKLYLADASGTMVYHTEGNLNSYFEYFLVNDFNGDGLTDLMMQEKHPEEPTYPNKKHYYFYQSNGNTFTRSTSYYLCYNNERLDVVDYNGDGVLEFMFHNTSNYWYLYTYSGTSIYSASIPSFGKYYIVDTGMQNRILDFNGDGCSDLLTLFDDGYKVYEFKGNNNILVETYSGTNIDNSDFILFGDYNGDGAIDILKRISPTAYTDCYLLSLTNSGFQSRSTATFDNFDIYVWNNRMYARDMNADGRTDIVLVGRGQDTANPYNRINVAISSGNDFAITEYISSTTMQNGLDRYFNFGDYNGDNRYQLFYKYASTSKLFSFASGTPSHLAGTLFDGLGAKTSLTYLPMSNSNVYTRGTGAVYPLMDFSSAFQLVSQVASDNGIGGTTAVGYQYAGAKAHQQGKGFLGFSQVTATNAATGISTENRYSFDETYYYQQLRAVYARLGNDTISTMRNTWNENSFGNKRIFPYIQANTQTDKLAGLTVQTTVSSYDSYGNPASVIKNFGGGHTRTTSYVYNDEQPDNWLIGRPTTITETSVKGGDTRTFVTERSYFSTRNSPDTDRYNQGDASAWQLAREYDAFGNLWKEHQSATGLYIRSTIYTYDSNGVNLLSITDPVGRETAYTYVPATGLVSTETDPFGNLTTYNYNSADQPGSIVPDGGINITYTRSLDVTGGPANARYSVQETGSDGSQVKTWYDKLEREIRNETKGFSGTMVKVDRQYNLKGQLSQVSEPSTGTPSNWNVIGYDGYGRVTSQDPYFGATTSFSYSGATTTRTVNSRTYTSTIDATALVTERTDPGGSMTYAYFPDGLLKSTQAPGSVTTSMTYDRNGNRLTIVDPSAGTITNTWYGTGEVKTQQSARGLTTTYAYQAGGLLDYYTASPADEGQTNYTYNTDGQVTDITSPGGVSRGYTYDTRGRVGTITESIGGVSNTVTFNYDSSGRLYRKYFNGTDYEQYDYDSNNGYLYRIQFNGTTVWQLTTMDDYGRIRQASIGGVTGTWTYDANNMLSQIAAAGVQQYDYSFNVNTGNLNSRTNFLKSKTESFGYDAVGLDRLTSVTGPANLTVGYTPNNNGNIQSKSDAGTGSYAYSTMPYAVSSITGAQNISTTLQDIDYYSFEKVKKITEGTKTADFVYNADQQRIRMILKDNGATTKTRWYFGSNCEREQVGSTTTQYIWIGGDAYSAVAVARKVGSGSWEVFNIFRDHLGTITHLKNGSTVYEYSFDAWGRRRDKDDWTYTLSGEPALFADRGFTAHEHLTDFNLVNMNGRLYDPVVGRFLSPDPFVQAADFSQGFNRYSYALNNPLVYSDTEGEWFFSAILGPLGVIIDAALWSATIDAGLQGIKIATGIQKSFNWSELGGSFIAGAVGGTMGLAAPSFNSPGALMGDKMALIGKYAGKAGYAALTAAVSAGAGMLTTDFLNNGRIDFSGEDYLNTMLGAGLISGGISIASSIYKYKTWDRFDLDQKIEILKNELNIDNLQLDIFSKGYGYTNNDMIYLTPLGLENKAISKLAIFHEQFHIQDLNMKFNPENIPRDDESITRILEGRAHLATLNSAPNYNIPSRYWWNSRMLLRNMYEYAGPMPNTLRLKHIWYNLFY